MLSETLDFETWLNTAGYTRLPRNAFVAKQKMPCFPCRQCSLCSTERLVNGMFAFSTCDCECAVEWTWMHFHNKIVHAQSTLLLLRVSIPQAFFLSTLLAAPRLLQSVCRYEMISVRWDNLNTCRIPLPRISRRSKHFGCHPSIGMIH